MQSQIKMLAECPGLSSRLSLNELQTTFSTLSTLSDNAEMHTNDVQEAEKEVQRLKAVSKAKKQLRASILPCSSLQVWPYGGAPEYGPISPSKSDIPVATVMYQFTSFSGAASEGEFEDRVGRAVSSDDSHPRSHARWAHYTRPAAGRR